jgi:hypothetical protein
MDCLADLAQHILPARGFLHRRVDRLDQCQQLACPAKRLFRILVHAKIPSPTARES